MNQENKIEELMSFLLPVLKKPSSWISLLAPPLFFFLGFGSLQIILTSSALILSTFFFISSKHNQTVFEDKPQEPETESEAEADQGAATSVQKHRDQQDHKDYFARSTHSLLESQDYQSSNTEDSDEFDAWPYRENTDFSDGSISDEDSLFELSLPSGHYVGHDQHYNEEEKQEKEIFNKFILQKNFQDFLPQPIFPQRALMELLTEFNDMSEEENLIEIDISMGSIKCSRVEIGA